MAILPSGDAAATGSHGQEKLDSALVRGLAWLTGVKWAVQLISWVTTILVAQLLTPADYGLMGMAGALLVFMTMMSESGIGVTVVTVRETSSEQLRQLHATAILVGIFSFGVGLVLALPMGWFYEQPAVAQIVAVSSLVLVFASFRIVPAALLQRDLQFRVVALINTVQALIQSSTTVVLAYAGYRYWSLVFGTLVGSAAASVVAILMRPQQVSRPRRSELAPLFPLTRDVLLTRMLRYAYQNADFIVAGKRLGKEALGAYSYAWTLASMPVDKLGAIIGDVMPSLFSAVQKDVEALKRYFLLVVGGIAVAAFPVTVGMALVAGDLVPTVFGAKWMPMIPPLVALASYSAIRAITPVAMHLLVVTGDTGFQVRRNTVAAIVLPIGFYIGSRWGPLGIAMAWVVIDPFVVFIPTHVRLFRRLGLKIRSYLKALWPAMSSTAAMALGVLVVQYLTDQYAPRPRLAASIVVAMIIYGGTLVLFHRSSLQGFQAIVAKR
jgi:O-antigen/teichoic acid export membrane protein